MRPTSDSYAHDKETVHNKENVLWKLFSYHPVIPVKIRFQTAAEF